MSGDPAEHGPYSVSLSGQARRNIREHLPLEVAAAAMETIEGSIAVNPYRAGKPLDEPFDGFYSARRGTYRIVYRIDEAKRLVETMLLAASLLYVTCDMKNAQPRLCLATMRRCSSRRSAMATPPVSRSGRTSW